MIQGITSYFDVVFAMPIESQCHFAIGLSFVGFVFAAFIRETCKQSLVRYGARIIGAASFFAVAAFANHVSHEYEKLNEELMVRRNEKATQIVEESVIAVTTSNGSKVQFGVSEDGLRISTAVGGFGGSELSVSSADTGTGGRGKAASRLGRYGRTNAVGGSGNAVVELPEWWRRWIWNDAGSFDRDAVSFTTGKKLEGKSY